MSSAIIRCSLPTTSKASAISFFREYPCELSIQLSGEASPHLRPVFFIYGVSAAVDALSGMTVNLVLVDQWAEEFLTDAAKRSWPTLKDFFQFATMELQKKAGLARATLTRLELIDEKQTRWAFDPDKNWQQWQCQFPVVVADQAQWLIFQAEVSMTTESGTSWMKKSWNSNADLLSDLQKYFSATEAIQVSLRNHRTGVEVRLR